MAIDTGLLFKIKADGSQAKAEARETARAVEDAFDKTDPFADFRARMDDMKRRLGVLKANAQDAARGVDDLDNSTRRTGGRSGGIGQFIEALAQGDPGELLGEVAQQGGKAGIAIAGVTLAAAAAGVAIGAMTARMIELVRETDKLAKDSKLTSTQIQGLQIVANLTGESVEDLAENYKKLGPEVKRFEELVKSSGAAIDADLRRKVQDSALAWEELKISAQGALNAIARESLPAVNGLLREMGVLIRDGANAWTFFGQVGGGAITALTTLLRQLRTEAVQTIIDLTSGPAGILNLISRDGANIAKDLAAPNAPSLAFPKIPSLKSGGKGKGREDITEAELQTRLLRAQQDEAQRGLNGTREAAERLYDITIKLYEAERAQAASELPRARAAKLAEIQQKEKEALEKYAELLKKISDEELKPIEALTKQINADNERALQLMREQVEAERELRLLRLERREIEADLLDQSALDLARSGGSRLKVAERQARAAAIREDIAFERATISIERERQQAEALEDFARVKELNALLEAEQKRHVAALAEIGRSLDVINERLNPLSRRSLFGDAFADLRAAGESNLFALAESARASFEQMSNDAGNFATIAGGAVATFTQGLGEMFAAMILGGETGPAALRKLTAAVLAQVAQQAAVKAVFELAQGFASLFVNPPAAAAHFTAAALYGSVAVGAGLAARAINPSTEAKGGAQAAASAVGERKRTITQDTGLGIGPILESNERLQAVTAGVSEGIAAGNENNQAILLHVQRIRENTDLMIEQTRDARTLGGIVRNIFEKVTGGFLGFSSGGYTGDGAAGSFAGLVHRGEYVFSSSAVRNMGVRRLEAMHRQAKAGGSDAAAGGGMSLRVYAAPGIIVEQVAEDYRNNGVMRQIIRGDLGAS